MAREEAPVSQVKILVSRSGGYCAYPGCGRALVRAQLHDQDRPKAVGKVAHISAASPEGARYDATMTDQQRGSADNLLYLCGDCHDVIDTQLNYHTLEFLHQVKGEHESRVARAVAYSMGLVGFVELQLVCDAISTLDQNPTSTTNFTMPIDIQEKIELNALSRSSEEKITLGLAKAEEVRTFLEKIDGVIPRFADKLTASFKELYYSGKRQALESDDLFDFVCVSALENCGPSRTDIVDAAALAVVAYLFQICEIFEYEHAATN